MWSVCMKRHKEHTPVCKSEFVRERASEQTSDSNKVKINCAHVTMKMTICSQSSRFAHTHTHKRKYVVAFQEIEEMQIKLAAVAAVCTHTPKETHNSKHWCQTICHKNWRIKCIVIYLQANVKQCLIKSFYLRALIENEHWGKRHTSKQEKKTEHFKIESIRMVVKVYAVMFSEHFLNFRRITFVNM